MKNMLWTPPMRAHQAPAHDAQEQANGAILTRALSAPGRDGEEKQILRPIRKKHAVSQYEQEYPKTPRGQLQSDDFEEEHDSYHCFAAEDGGK